MSLSTIPDSSFAFLSERGPKTRYEHQVAAERDAMKESRTQLLSDVVTEVEEQEFYSSWARDIEAKNEAIMGSKDKCWASYMFQMEQLKGLEYVDDYGIVWAPRLYDEIVPEALDYALEEWSRTKLYDPISQTFVSTL